MVYNGIYIYIYILYLYTYIYILYIIYSYFLPTYILAYMDKKSTPNPACHTFAACHPIGDEVQAAHIR